eukprot:756886-Hanusia_phi.AAC.5
MGGEVRVDRREGVGLPPVGGFHSTAADSSSAQGSEATRGPEAEWREGSQARGGAYKAMSRETQVESRSLMCPSRKLRPYGPRGSAPAPLSDWRSVTTADPDGDRKPSAEPDLPSLADWQAERRPIREPPSLSQRLSALR